MYCKYTKVLAINFLCNKRANNVKLATIAIVHTAVSQMPPKVVVTKYRMHHSAPTMHNFVALLWLCFIFSDNYVLILVGSMQMQANNLYFLGSRHILFCYNVCEEDLRGGPQRH